MAENKPVIWVGCEADYFLCGDWTGQISLKRLGKFGGARKRGNVSGSLYERSDMRDSLSKSPGYRFAHPGYAR
jgi:hypothetical protein